MSGHVAFGLFSWFVFFLLANYTAVTTVVLLFLWGSFLNATGSWLISDIAPSTQTCPLCKKYWYLKLSWLFSRCLHPYTLCWTWIDSFIELATAISITLLTIHTPITLQPAYFIFFSALIVCMRTDLQALLLSRYTTLCFIPIGFTCAATHMLPLPLLGSLMGATLGYLLLFVTAKIFTWLTGKHGMGQGDLELLAMIGAFTGPIGCWMTLLIGSVVGSFVGISLIIFGQRTLSTKLPFGPFLALGAIAHVLYGPYVISFLLFS